MSKTLKNILKYTVILSIMVFLLYNTFMDIPEEALDEDQSRLDFILSYWTKCNKFYLLLSVVIAIVSHLSRAMRWKIALEPLGYRNVSTFNAFNAVMNGYFINLFIPRGGELSRPYSLEKTDAVPTDVGVGTVVTERIIDLLFLMLCIGSAFVFNYDVITGFLSEAWVYLQESEEGNSEEGISKLTILAIVGAVGFLAVIVLFLLKKDLFLMLKEKATGFLKGMIDGILSIFKLEKWGLYIFHSVFIWTMYYLMLFVVFLAFEETLHIGFADALMIFIIGGIAMAIPIPGGAGAYHKMVSFGLIQLCGVAEGPAIAIVTVFHAVQTVLNIALGGASVYFISKNTINNQDAK